MDSRQDPRIADRVPDLPATGIWQDLRRTAMAELSAENEALYRALARQLNAMPNGFPATQTGAGVAPACMDVHA